MAASEDRRSQKRGFRKYTFSLGFLLILSLSLSFLSISNLLRTHYHARHDPAVIFYFEMDGLNISFRAEENETSQFNPKRTARIINISVTHVEVIIYILAA